MINQFFKILNTSKIGIKIFNTAVLILMICLSNASYSEYSDIEYTHPSGSKFRLLKDDAKYFIQYEALDYKDYFEVPEEIVNQK